MIFVRKTDTADFDLLPNQFRLDKRLETTRYVWMTVIAVLIALLISTTVAEALTHRFETNRRQQLISAAFPIVSLRQQIQMLRATQTSKTELIKAVESARPGSDLLQTMAAIARNTPVQNQSIEIEHLRLQLPLEYKKQGESEEPSWATGTMMIVATADSSSVARQWANEIKKLPRVKQEDFKEEVPFQNPQVFNGSVSNRPSQANGYAKRDATKPRQPVTLTASALTEARLP